MAVILPKRRPEERAETGARPALGTVRWTIRLEASNGLDETKLGTIPSSHGVVRLGRGGAVGDGFDGDMRPSRLSGSGPRPRA